MIEGPLGDLLAYGIETGLIEAGDLSYVRNRILEVLRIDDYDLTAEGSGARGTIDELEMVRRRTKRSVQDSLMDYMKGKK